MTSPDPSSNADGAGAEVASRWPERPARTARTLDWKDCQHCRHYTSGGSSGGVPPWPVCQFWPRLDPATCRSYAYTHRPWLDADGAIWGWGDDGAHNAPRPDDSRAPALSTPSSKDRPKRTYPMIAFHPAGEHGNAVIYPVEPNDTPYWTLIGGQGTDGEGATTQNAVAEALVSAWNSHAPPADGEVTFWKRLADEHAARAEKAEAERDALAERVRVLEDKVEGLTDDLESAVEVAFKRGATEWTRLNYPKRFAALTGKGGEDATYPPERNEFGVCGHGIRLSDGCADCIEEYARAFIPPSDQPQEGGE